MDKEDWKLVVETAKEIEKEVYELTEKISLRGRGIGILRTGLRKTAFSIVSNVTQAISDVRNRDSLICLQGSLSQLMVLDYYNFISRKVGYLSSSQYLRLKKMAKDITDRLSLSLKDLERHGSDSIFPGPMKV